MRRRFAWAALWLAGCAALLSGCKSTEAPRDYQKTLARFFLEASDARSISVTLPQSGVQVAVNAQPVITEGDIADVALAQVELGKCLMFQLVPSASRDLYRLTGSNQGRRLVLTLNGSPFGARRMDGPVVDGVLFIFVEMPDEALPKLVDDLKKSTIAVQRDLGRKG